MAFNKLKAQENALKFLNQGKPSQAISEYQQILRNDPKDQATLITADAGLPERWLQQQGHRDLPKDCQARAQ